MPAPSLELVLIVTEPTLELLFVVFDLLDEELLITAEPPAPIGLGGRVL